MTEKSGKKVVVVVPFLNEEENLPVLYERLTKCMEDQPEDFEIIFIDDGSTDSSPQWVADRHREDARVKLLRMSRNFGHQIAITAGMDEADGDAVVIMDADLQDPPEVIPDLLEKWREGYDVVYAVRASREGESWSKKFLAATFYKVFRSLVKIEVPLNAGDFRLVSRRALDALCRVRKLHRFVRGLTSWVGFKQCAVHYERAPRNAGHTKYPVWKSAVLAIDAITSFSGAPLRWMMGFGFVVSAAGVLLAIWLIIGHIFGMGTLEPGWTSQVSLLLLLGGIQLICLGLLGQYVSRIYEESKKRPLYFIKERVGAFPGNE